MNPGRLRRIPILACLSAEELEEMAASGVELRLAPGDYLFRQGERAEAFHLVLDGQLETTRDVGGEQVLLMSHGPDGYLGAMALLTDTPYRGTTRAVADSVVLAVEGDDLRRLALAHPALLREFMPAIESVSGAIKGVERDREKLLAVGSLAAGLAHELNNPAAAAARSASALRDFERLRQAAFVEIADAGASAERLAALVRLGSEATEETVPGERLDPLAESDREEEIIRELEERGLPDAMEIASTLREAGLGMEWVDRVAAGVGDRDLSAGLRFVGACAGARILMAELEEATSRIVGLVGAVRSYSYLDQGPRQAVDIHAGLESTLSLLSHKLREKRVEIARDFDPALPRVEASGSELNQVWTNLIDNAADALSEGGRITLRTRTRGGHILVEVCDDGPGIPPEVRARVFDAFFTTKPVGRGTGLGLDIAQRIVVRHHGELRLDSQPGDTRFQVVLPVG